MASFLNKIFRRKKQPPLVCAVSLDESGSPIGHNPKHEHTAACFLDFEDLAILELFQSQGCVSCPPAVPGIQNAASMSPNRLLLTYNVTVFDHLGWKDTFARASSDMRQRAYLQRWRRTSLYTPMVIVNGVVDTSGAHGPNDIDEAVQKARSAISQVKSGFHLFLDANDTEVRIDSDVPAPASHAHPAAMPSSSGEASILDEGITAAPLPPSPPFPTYDIMLAVYRSKDETIKIGKGPNKGKKLVHRNEVENLIKIGEWNGGNVTVPLPSSRSAMAKGQEAVAFVQLGSGGPIVTAVKL